MPSPSAIRIRQTDTFLELRPIVQDLEEALRIALKSWKDFTSAMESVAHLYDQYASFIPNTDNADKVGLDASDGVTADTMKLCKTFKKTASLWNLSDEVVDLRSQLFAEWALWRRTERRLSKVADLAVERKKEAQKVKKMRKNAVALAQKQNVAGADRIVKSLESKITSAEESMKQKDVVIAEDFKILLKKSFLRDRGGASKTGQVLYNVGRGLVKAFEGFSKGENVSPVTPIITRTPAMGIPLQADVQTSERLQPATPMQTEAEYGRGFPYASSECPFDVTLLEERYISIST